MNRRPPMPKRTRLALLLAKRDAEARVRELEKQVSTLNAEVKRLKGARP